MQFPNPRFCEKSTVPTAHTILYIYSLYTRQMAASYILKNTLINYAVQCILGLTNI